MIAKCEQCTKYVEDNCTALKYITIKNGKCVNFSPDNITAAQHRLYRGLMLPALTEALGETNNQYVHDFILKPEWIYRKVGFYYYPVLKYDDIPKKYQARCRVVYDYDMNCQKIVGYVPSSANFTRAEAKDYFKFCEIMLEEVGGQIPAEHNIEYATLRERV